STDFSPPDTATIALYTLSLHDALPISPDVKNPRYFAKAFTAIQDLIDQTWVMAGHDISSGGLVTALLEMCFPVQNIGLKVKIDRDRKSTRLNSSHVKISYAVFCLKKKI